MNLSHIQFHRNEKEAMNYTDQVKRDAKAAADYIREHGWCQGRRSHNGAVCAKEAMERVCIFQHPELGPMTKGLVGLAIAFEENTPDKTIVGFNDAQGRTKEEVLAIYDRIANS